MLAEAEHVEPDRVGQPDLLDQLAEALRRADAPPGHRIRADVAESVEPEFHGGFSLSSPICAAAVTPASARASTIYFRRGGPCRWWVSRAAATGAGRPVRRQAAASRADAAIGAPAAARRTFCAISVRLAVRRLSSETEATRSGP